MNNFILTCGSTADLSREHLEKRNIHYLPYGYVLEDKAYDDDLGLTMSYSDFYKKIKAGAMPTTNQINTAMCKELFERCLKEGNSVLHVAFSSGLSGSCSSVQVIARELNEIYTDAKVVVVDSLAASLGYGLLVDTICDLRDNGATIEEAAQFVQDNKLNVHHWFFSTDLTHFKRGGRVSAASAFFGTMLNICPLLNVSNEGKLIPRKKIRGKKSAIKEIVQTMVEHAQNGVDYDGKCYISQSDCIEDAQAVRDLIESKFPKLKGKVMIGDIGVVVGSHAGPGTVALFFMGDTRVD